MDELQHLEDLMYGINYGTYLGLLTLPSGTSLDAAAAAIAEVYPEAELSGPTPTDAAALWEEIRFGFDYRGEPSRGSGLDVTEAEEARLRELQGRYRDYVQGFIDAESAIYTGGMRGLPGYPLYWDFRLLILNADRPGLLLFGNASD